jgi:predicted O-methyltransferase YrrM
MEHRDKLYPMRPEALIHGLKSLIEYIEKNYNRPLDIVAEIGCYAGESTIIFAEKFKNVIAIDPFINDYDPNDVTCQFMYLTEVYNTFKSNIFHYPNIKHIREISDEAHERIEDKSLDFVYIDGLHTYEQVLNDIKNYLPKIKDGGFIGGHDYSPNWQGVVNAINESFSEIDCVFSDTSWVVKVKKKDVS